MSDTVNRLQDTTQCRGCHRRWLSLAQCHCTVCHRQFGSISTFDAHRVDGRCRSAAELEGGLPLSPRGKLRAVMAGRPEAWGEVWRVVRRWVPGE